MHEKNSPGNGIALHLGRKMAYGCIDKPVKHQLLFRFWFYSYAFLWVVFSDLPPSPPLHFSKVLQANTEHIALTTGQEFLPD